MMKGVVITSLDINYIVHFELSPQDQTVHEAYYVELLNWLREAVHRKKHEFWPNRWILHHDNAPAHKALSVKLFLAKKIDY